MIKINVLFVFINVRKVQLLYHVHMHFVWGVLLIGGLLIKLVHTVDNHLILSMTIEEED
jgi:hypothetical protein